MTDYYECEAEQVNDMLTCVFRILVAGNVGVMAVFFVMR
jgi:hypothetical protein